METNQELLAKYLDEARKAGCPEDQVEYFLRCGIVLQPRQLAFAAASRLCDHDDGPTQIGFGGARMGGKSHAVLSVVGGDCYRHPGLKALLLRKVGAAAREGFETLLPKTIGSLGTYKASDGLFRFANGSWIKTGHFKDERDIDKYLGLEYDVVAVEEATTLSFRKKQAVQSCCRSPKGSGWRARMYESTNPGGVGHAWFKETFVAPYRNKSERRTRFIPSTVDDNAFASDDYRQFLDGLTGWLKRAWRYGDWDIAAGQFFTTFNRDAHVLKSKPTIADGWRTWVGLDYGFVHYTAAYLFAQSGDGDVYVVDEHAARNWIVERHAGAINGLLSRNGIPLERLTGIFAGSDVFAKKQNGGTVSDDYRSHGLKLKPANMDRINGAAEILRRLGDVEADPQITPSLFFSPTCPRLIECLPSLEHDEHRPEDVLKVDCDDDGRGGDDYYDALRYGCMAAANRRKFAITYGPEGS